jgi:hypothetical protein
MLRANVAASTFDTAPRGRSALFAVAGFVFLLLQLPAPVLGQEPVTPVPPSRDLAITDARVYTVPELELLVFEQRVRGRAGGTVPPARGQMDGAPVLGYVFPTTLAPEDMGFAPGEGVVALAATSHPDFDDTPLWDEGMTGRYDDDGAIFHSHWVVLVPDDRVPGGLSVKAAQSADEELPPTNPGMPMYLNSPGFNVVLDGDVLRIVVPWFRVSGRKDFSFDAVTAYMQVNTSDGTRPVLGVYQVYQVLSGDLSLPYRVSGGR